MCVEVNVSSAQTNDANTVNKFAQQLQRRCEQECEARNFTFLVCDRCQAANVLLQMQDLVEALKQENKVLRRLLNLEVKQWTKL